MLSVISKWPLPNPAIRSSGVEAHWYMMFSLIPPFGIRTNTGQTLEIAVEVAAAAPLAPHRTVELIRAAIGVAIVLETREDGAVPG